MSASADLFQAPVTFDPDLRVSASWRDIPDPAKNGEPMPWVRESFCGRYTICWSVQPGADANAKIFLVWRRHPFVDGRRPMPSLIGRAMSAREARLIAAEHAEANP